MSASGLRAKFPFMTNGGEMKRILRILKMKKVLGASIALALLVGSNQIARADAPTKPIISSFTITPDTVDIATANTVISLDLIATNPSGIASSQTLATLTDGGSNVLTVALVRTDSPVQNSLTTVKFHGSIKIPSTLPSGAYTASAAPVTGLTYNGIGGYQSEVANATTTSKVVGAEDSLLVRSNGLLNYSYATFVGPAWNKTAGATYLNSKYRSVADPIWKVGETLNLSDYYELQVPSLSLKVKSNSPSICTVDGTTLKFILTGACSFTAYTDATSDYQVFKDEESVTITSARTKPTYYVGTIPTQSSATLPLSIQGPFVAGPLGYVLPVTATPTVCYGVGNYITVISGGTCTVNYSSPASASYLASDVFPITFEITRSAQTLSFVVPATATLASKSVTLSATSSSGRDVSYLSMTPTICAVTGNSLNFLTAGTCQITATQIGSATLAPASVNQSILITGSPVVPKSATKTVKKLTCIKNGKIKTVTTKKCPSGYKPKK